MRLNSLFITISIVSVFIHTSEGTLIGDPLSSTKHSHPSVFEHEGHELIAPTSEPSYLPTIYEIPEVNPDSGDVLSSSVPSDVPSDVPSIAPTIKSFPSFLPSDAPSIVPSSDNSHNIAGDGNSEVVESDSKSTKSGLKGKLGRTKAGKSGPTSKSGKSGSDGKKGKNNSRRGERLKNEKASQRMIENTEALPLAQSAAPFPFVSGLMLVPVVGMYFLA